MLCDDGQMMTSILPVAIIHYVPYGTSETEKSMQSNKQQRSPILSFVPPILPAPVAGVVRPATSKREKALTSLQYVFSYFQGRALSPAWRRSIFYLYRRTVAKLYFIYLRRKCPSHSLVTVDTVRPGSVSTTEHCCDEMK